MAASRRPCPAISTPRSSTRHGTLKRIPRSSQQSARPGLGMRAGVRDIGQEPVDRPTLDAIRQPGRHDHGQIRLFGVVTTAPAGLPGLVTRCRAEKVASGQIVAESSKCRRLVTGNSDFVADGGEVPGWCPAPWLSARKDPCRPPAGHLSATLANLPRIIRNRSDFVRAKSVCQTIFYLLRVSSLRALLQ